MEQINLFQNNNLNCKIGSFECYTQVYTFNDLFIKWSCCRENMKLSNLCPLNSKMVIDEMQKIGYSKSPNPNISGEYYNGIKLCSEVDLKYK